MQKINSIIIFILILIGTASCGGFKYAEIFKGKDIRISYINSRKIGERIKTNLTIDKQVFEYNIYLGYQGSQLHIIRYAPQPKIKNKTMLDTYREMEFLVTDTSKNNPNYLGNQVNGYYDPAFFRGSYEVEKLKKIIIPVSVKEYEMLRKIKEVLSAKQIDFQVIDSVKVIGWFKYEF